MLGFKLFSGFGRQRAAAVDEEHALRVCTYPPDLPPLGAASRYRYYQGKLGSGGLDTGTTSQNVDGSGTSQEFYVQAETVPDIFIMGIGILIEDSQVVHGSFGNVSALGTGWDLKIEDASGTLFLIEKATTGGEIIARTGGARPFGADATSFELTNMNGTNDAYLGWFPIGEYVPGGLRLGRGTMARIVSVVNDDLTGLVDFEVRVFGYRLFPK